MKKILKLLLLWHSPYSRNLGVQALTFSQESIIREISKKTGLRIDLSYAGWNVEVAVNEVMQKGAEKYDYFCINSKSIFFGKNSFTALVKGYDLVLDVGEGDSFSDIYGFKRFIYLYLTKLIVEKSGAKLVLSPQTIGPFNTRIAKYLAKGVLNNSHSIFVRDRLSMQALKSIGVRTECKESTDLAFFLPYEKSRYSFSPGKLKIGLNVSALLFYGGYGNTNTLVSKDDYRILIGRLIDHFLNVDNSEVYLIPHVDSNDEIENDFLVCLELQKKYNSLKLSPKFSDPVDAKSYISNMDFFLGSRMHACIAAFSTGVATLPLAYSRKFKGLFETVGYTRTLELMTLSNDEIVRAAEEAFLLRKKLKSEAMNCQLEIQKRSEAYSSYLEKQLMEIVKQ